MILIYKYLYTNYKQWSSLKRETKKYFVLCDGLYFLELSPKDLPKMVVFANFIQSNQRTNQHPGRKMETKQLKNAPDCCTEMDRKLEICSWRSLYRFSKKVMDFWTKASSFFREIRARLREVLIKFGRYLVRWSFTAQLSNIVSGV